jgi:hypothetical protein
MNIQDQKEIINSRIKYFDYLFGEYGPAAEQLGNLFKNRVLCDDKPQAALCPTCGVLASTMATCSCGAQPWLLFRLAEVGK